MRRLQLLVGLCWLAALPGPAIAGGRAPFSQVATGGGAVWAADGTSAVRLSPENGRPLSTPVPSPCCDHLYPGAVVIADGGLWSIGGGMLTHRDASTGRRLAPTLRVGSPPSSLVADSRRIWVIDMLGRRVSQISTVTGRSAGRSLILGPRLWAGHVALGSLWVTQLGYRTPRERREGGPGRPGHVFRVSLSTGRVQAVVRVGRDPLGVADSAGSIWVANAEDGTLSQIGPLTNRVVRVVRLGGSPMVLAATPRTLLVGSGSRIVRVDTRTGRVRGSLRAGSSVLDLAVEDGSLWVGREGSSRPTRLILGPP